MYVVTQGGGFLKLERLKDGLRLEIAEGIGISFQYEWVEQLRDLPYDQYGDFVRGTIYPALTDSEKKIWNKSTISNKKLFGAIQALQ